MASNVVKIEQCFPYMVYKNKAFAFAISVLASYLYKLQHTDRHKNIRNAGTHTHTYTMDSGYNIHHIILRHHSRIGAGYHHGEPESVENDPLGDRAATCSRYRAPVLFLLRAG